ncbi:MAG: hypothetical protein IT178_16635 [Acidobacteria bacterium]|nr:hypothetical protein [Acidobacteriota bacterium]
MRASRSRVVTLLAGPLLATMIGCGQSAPPAPIAAKAPERPNDPQHAGITEPHGDHSPHHGGLVLMNGDVHYEVVMDPSGKYALWFSDELREDLPATIATNVRLVVTRAKGPEESVALTLDDAGESWIGQGRPITAEENAIVKVSYDLRGEPHEVEIPFVAGSR